MIRVGVDVGGTFTDIVLERTRVVGKDEQQVVVTKVPSTPHDQSEGVVAGVLQVCKQAGVGPGDIDLLFHGTTVATNMVIERNGADVGNAPIISRCNLMCRGKASRWSNGAIEFQ